VVAVGPRTPAAGRMAVRRPARWSRRMKRMHGGVGLRLLLGLVLFVLIAAAGMAWQRYSSFVHAPLTIRGQGQTLVVPRGTSFNKIVAMLHARKLTAAPDLFWRALAMRMHVVDSLDAGEYALTPGMTPSVLLRHMATGKVLQHHFTLVDGWTFKEVRAALAATPGLVHDSAGLSAARIMQRLGAPGKKPEGRFLPETYAYVRGDTDMDLLKRA